MQTRGPDSCVSLLLIHPLPTLIEPSLRGLLVLSGSAPDAEASERIVRSSDGAAAVWVGCIDDLWSFGKPRGVGGPWLNSPFSAHVPSDPYFVMGFDQKSSLLRHEADRSVEFVIDIGVTGD
ncbi:MAG: hypothetical protein ACI841_001559 [Planctomycetota bacterium]|jgi:hypothetical protein